MSTPMGFSYKPGRTYKKGPLNRLRIRFAMGSGEGEGFHVYTHRMDEAELFDNMLYSGHIYFVIPKGSIFRKEAAYGEIITSGIRLATAADLELMHVSEYTKRDTDLETTTKLKQ